jgi:hypothetical protein
VGDDLLEGNPAVVNAEDEADEADEADEDIVAIDPKRPEATALTSLCKTDKK